MKKDSHTESRSSLDKQTEFCHDVDPNLTKLDRLVLRRLLEEVEGARQDRHHDRRTLTLPRAENVDDDGYYSQSSNSSRTSGTHANKQSKTSNDDNDDEQTLRQMRAYNDPAGTDFVPTVFVSWDMEDLAQSRTILGVILQHYTRWARTVVRHDTDVVMLTHLLLYLCTSVPSALCLYHHFSLLHGVLHTVMSVWYAGSYTLMMHQHIHQRGILKKRYAWLDTLFPYVTDPLMGHTWNSYFYHHVKHHHVEGNGPDDLSSTIRYQRDSPWDFACYVLRFLGLIWLELPLYFLSRRHQPWTALKVFGSELANFCFLALLATHVSFRATTFVFLLPLAIMRIGLMVGNWGQHAFVDESSPNSDFRSSITLIDVASNRFCFNDGYHTSHHLNPRRHWRDHPVSFLQQKTQYADEGALVFVNIDYLMLTIKLLCKDYGYLARRLVPMSEDQKGMSVPEIAHMLRTKTRRFTEEDIREKFKSV